MQLYVPLAIHLRLSAEAAQFRDWISAEELAELNTNIVGPIEVVAEFRGPTV